MSKHRTPMIVIAALLAATSLPGLAAAAADPAALPRVHLQGAVEYRSGGIGHDEAEALRADAAHWPVTLTFDQLHDGHGEYLADVHVCLRDAQGRTVLDTTAGPLLYLRLPPGRYVADLDAGGRPQQRVIELRAHGSWNGVVTWPALGHAG